MSPQLAGYAVSGPRCECTENTGLVCRARAAWLVGIGSRVIDRQYACGRHLHRTCRAMLGAEKPRTAALTITPADRTG